LPIKPLPKGRKGDIFVALSSVFTSILFETGKAIAPA
jgi:hypothetical protein